MVKAYGYDNYFMVQSVEMIWPVRKVDLNQQHSADRENDRERRQKKSFQKTLDETISKAPKNGGVAGYDKNAHVLFYLQNQHEYL